MFKKTDINFDWKYYPDFKEEYIGPEFNDDFFETVHIPHSNIVLPYNNFDEKLYQFESCYRKKLWIDSFNEDENVYIKFEGVMTFAKVYLNGKYIGKHKGGYTPFRLDLTKAAIQEAENSLVVYVDSREREDIPPFGFVVDYLTYGGIYREVALEYCHDSHFEHVGVTTKNVLTDAPEIRMDLFTYNKSKKPQTLNCQFELIADEKTIYKFQRKIKLNPVLKERIRIKKTVPRIRLWGLDNPNLYQLKVSLIKDEKVIDDHNIRFGFREIRFTSKGFYLNGEKIKIRGLNRHQSFPYVGSAMPKSAQYKDADILKYELGLNTVRLSHYPQSNHFMDRCDEIGLLVFDEIPGWQHVGNLDWQKIALKNVREMILKDMNHPSVIIWGVRINESQDYNDFYKKTNALARKLDSSRPTGGVRAIGHSNLLEDVYTYNDFVHEGYNQGLDKKKKITKTDKPYLVTEYNGHMFPTKKFDNESHRLSHALRHLNVLEAMEKDSDILGAIGWCMFDYNTHKDFGSGDKICYHGVMDMFRIPKHAAFVYQSQQNKIPVMHIASSLNIGEYKASLLEDIHIFTNCDYVKLYKNNAYINTFYPSKEKYPSVPHPPIIIDDLIGDAIKENEKFSPSDAEIVKEILLKVNKSGMTLSPKDTVRMGWLFLKYKMNMSHAEDLYTKYLGGWGGASTDYYFEGYRNDTCVLTRTKSDSANPKLVMSVDNNLLVQEATYDTTRVIVKLVDEYGNDMIYSHDTMIIETEGPIEVIGPKVVSLIGGSIGFWIKTTGEGESGKVKIISERFGTKEENIKVM